MSKFRVVTYHDEIEKPEENCEMKKKNVVDVSVDQSKIYLKTRYNEIIKVNEKQQKIQKEILHRDIFVSVIVVKERQMMTRRDEIICIPLHILSFCQK